MEMNIEHRLTGIEDRAKANTRRIEKLEEGHETLHKLAISVGEIATKQGVIASVVERLDGKVSGLEAKPAKRWEGIVDKIITAIAAAIVGFALANIGLPT